MNTLCDRCLIITMGGSASSAGAFLEQGGSRRDLLLVFLTEAGPCCLWATKTPHTSPASTEMMYRTERGACWINLVT